VYRDKIKILKESSIGIVNLNTFGFPLLNFSIKERYKKLAMFLEKENRQINIINFQEVFTYFTLQILKKELTSYPYIIYKKSFFGPKGGLVCFSKYPIEEFRFIPFPKKIFSLNSPHLLPFLFNNNGFLVLYLSIIPLVIINTHITSNLKGDWSKQDDLYQQQKNELKTITTFITDFARKKIPVVFSGDFNIPADSNLYKEFVKNLYIKDIFSPIRKATFHQEFLPPKREAQCVDYIFLICSGKNVQLVKRDYLFNEKVHFSNGQMGYLSDHVGLYTKVTFKNPI